MESNQIIEISTTIAMRLAALELHSKNASTQIKNVLFGVGSDGFITDDEKLALKNALNALEEINRRISPYDVKAYTAAHIQKLESEKS